MAMKWTRHVNFSSHRSSNLIFFWSASPRDLVITEMAKRDGFENSLNQTRYPVTVTTLEQHGKILDRGARSQRPPLKH